MRPGTRTVAAVLLAVFLLVLPPERAYPSMKPVKGGPKDTALGDPVDRSLRLSVRISGARKEAKRASYFKSVARQRMARKNRATGAPPRSSAR
jgi:hypothetical protein